MELRHLVDVAAAVQVVELADAHALAVGRDVVGPQAARREEGLVERDRRQRLEAAAPRLGGVGDELRDRAPAAADDLGRAPLDDVGDLAADDEHAVLGDRLRDLLLDDRAAVGGAEQRAQLGRARHVERHAEALPAAERLHDERPPQLRRRLDGRIDVAGAAQRDEARRAQVKRLGEQRAHPRLVVGNRAALLGDERRVDQNFFGAAAARE